jgi:RNA-directed DNA polymerase
MSEDAPVNTGAVWWPDPDSAYFAVRRMQTKLHRWATDDPGRRFDGLFNLVCDPAFLVAAWNVCPPTRAPRLRGSARPRRP